MLKTSAIAAIVVLATAALPSVSFAQMDNGAMSGRSMSNGQTGGMLRGNATRKKMKKMHRGTMMRHGMMKKPMTNGM